ncbi:MAG: DUF3019 domain-containing protein [Proteobacteria bacterium]|nr:DUF3019 domain-containing protein [Pseudomonadota bacterium]
MNKILLICIILVLFVVKTGYGQTADYELTSSGVVLIIKPNICVAPRGMYDCISTIDFSWYSAVAKDYCLNVAMKNKSLNCWKNTDSGFYQHKVRINNDLNYWINAYGSQIQEASSVVKFATLKPHRKHTRSRLPWSITGL